MPTLRRAIPLLVVPMLLALATVAPASARRADTTAPVVDTVTWSPQTPYVYGAVALTATAHDDESGIAQITWAFGDGGTATGANVSHTFTQSGSVLVTVTAIDGAGNAGSTTAHVPVSAFQPEPPGTYDPPVLGRARLRPATISAGATPGVARRARLAFRLSDLTDTTDVAITLRGRHGLPTARRTIRDVREGRHVVRLGARVGGTRLPAGRYRVVVRARNAYGSDRSVTRLRVVR